MTSETTDHEDQDSPYLTVAEAAQMLKYSVRTIMRWADSGRLPFVVICGEKRFARHDLEATIERLNQPED